MNEDRKIVTEKLGVESFYDFLDQKTPEEVIERMKEFRAHQYGDRHISFNVEPYGYDGAAELELWEHRPETDEEYEARIDKELSNEARREKNRAAKEAKELAEYNRLKAKFG